MLTFLELHLVCHTVAPLTSPQQQKKKMLVQVSFFFYNIAISGWLMVMFNKKNTGRLFTIVHVFLRRLGGLLYYNCHTAVSPDPGSGIPMGTRQGSAAVSPSVP